MRGLHLHVGSQGCPINLFVEAIQVVHALALEINEAVGAKQVSILDIGGGLPMNYRSDEESPTFEQYIKEARPLCVCQSYCNMIHRPCSLSKSRYSP